MATKYLLNTPNADNTIDVSTQIGSTTIAGSQLQNNTVTSTQVDSTIALKSDVTDAIKGLTPKGSVAGVIFSDSLSGPVSWSTAGGGRITLGVYAPVSTIGPLLGYDGSTLSVNSKVLFSFATSDQEKAGIFNVAVGGAAGDPSVGSVTPKAGSSVNDGDTFTINDGLGNVVAFEFDSNSSFTPGNQRVAFTSGDTDAVIAASIVSAIGDSHLRLFPGSVTRVGAVVTISSALAGANGNTAITTTGSSLAAKSDFTGGTDGTYGYFERADNFNESVDVSFGAYVVVGAGTYSNQIWYLKTEGTIVLNSTALHFAHWGEAGVTYTAGNGISISGGNSISAKLKSAGGLEFSGTGSDEISVKVAASNALVKDGGSGELSVSTASASQSGVITAAQFKDLTRTVASSDEHATVSTSGSGYTDLSLSDVALPNNTLGIYSLSMNSKSTTGKWCVTQAKFALRKTTGDSTVVGNTLEIFKEGDASGITGLKVEAFAGASASDYVRITGVDGFDINHSPVVTLQLVQNPLTA
jgi:hypothetical protein